jgi:hypothetical protein
MTTPATTCSEVKVMIRDTTFGACAREAQGAEAARASEGRWPRICGERCATGAVKPEGRNVR